MKVAYRRLLVKLSGGRLAGDGGFGIDGAVISQIAAELREVHEMGCQLCVVIGGGNVIRGIQAAAQGVDRAAADYMGMMASVINGLALQSALEKEGLATRVLSALEIREAVGGSADQCRRALNRLIELEKVEFEGKTRATRYWAKGR